MLVMFLDGLTVLKLVKVATTCMYYWKILKVSISRIPWIFTFIIIISITKLYNFRSLKFSSFTVYKQCIYSLKLLHLSQDQWFQVTGWMSFLVILFPAFLGEHAFRKFPITVLLWINVNFRTDWIKKDGDCYKLKAGVVVDVHDDLPIIGQIEDIYVVDGSTIIFNVHQFATLYEKHYRAYVLQDSDNNILIPLTNIFLHSPVHIHRSQTLHNFVILPHALCTL